MSLQSHPVPDEHEEGGSNSGDSEIHETDSISIRVTQETGYLCHIKATAKFRLPPDKLFRQVITHPNNERIFRSMDRCSYRRVLEDDGNGRQKVEVAHEASWRFLVFKGKFTTRLLVEQDAGARVMRFALKPGSGGIMRKFAGQWSIEALPGDPDACLTALDQDIALAISVPPPLDRILKGISCSQVRKIMEDVQAEARRINCGKPTLEPWEEVHLTEIGV